MADEPRALREQTIIIEDTTAELKRLLNQAVFGGMLEAEFVKKADKLILDSTEEMKDDTLKANARSILRLFLRGFGAREEDLQLRECGGQGNRLQGVTAH